MIVATPAAYVGRFAPSPTGPLHAGSVVAALASWLDARAHDGRWLVRIEDIDPPREQAGASEAILHALHRLGLEPDEPVLFQHTRRPAHLSAIARLDALGRVYRCSCSRREIRERLAALGRDGGDEAADTGPPYPGTCRQGPARERSRYALRYRVDERVITWADRPAGHGGGAQQYESLARTCGDFVLERADGLISYQLAVVVDDAACGVTDVVRGSDLVSSTARQHDLADALGVARPRTLHVPVMRDRDGAKLSKQTGAPAVAVDGDEASRVAVLDTALAHLGLPATGAARLADWRTRAIQSWRASHWSAR